MLLWLQRGLTIAAISLALMYRNPGMTSFEIFGTMFRLEGSSFQFGEDLEVHFRTMIGTGANPNVAAVVVIGIEPGWTKKIADGIAETGKPVAQGQLDVPLNDKGRWQALQVGEALAGLPAELCRKIGLGYLDPTSIDPARSNNRFALLNN